MLIEILVAFAIAALCAVIHITTLFSLLQWMFSKKENFDRRLGFRHFAPWLIFVFGVILILHVFEAGIWGAFYACYNLFPDFETSIYFSLGSYTTIGYGDVVLPRTWRLLGAIEGILGVLLCGVSTAFLFALINAIFRMRVEQLHSSSDQLK